MGFLTDSFVRNLGLPLVTGDIPGVAVIIGGAEDPAETVALAKGYQAQGILVTLPGDAIRHCHEAGMALGEGVRVVANKVRDERDEEFIKQRIPAEDLLGFIHYTLEIMDADRNGQSPYDYSPKAIEEIRKIKAVLDRDDP